MSGVRYVWAVEPAPDVGWAEQGLWVQHALRSSKRFQAPPAPGPASSGPRPRAGAVRRPPARWRLEQHRQRLGPGHAAARVVRTIRAQGFGPGEAPAVVCPTCERLAAGLDPGRDPW